VDASAFGVPYDGGVSNKPGTRYGPAAPREATDRRSRTFDFEDEPLYVDYGHEVHENGVEVSIRSAIDYVTEDVDSVYLTIDIDVTDPSCAPGTGTPSPGGLASHQLLQAADLLVECDAIGAMDLMEVAPTLDPTDSMNQSILTDRTVDRIHRRRTPVNLYQGFCPPVYE
jgi:arginase family enzyme